MVKQGDAMTALGQPARRGRARGPAANHSDVELARLLHLTRSKIVRPGHEQSRVRLQAIVKPAANEIAGAASAVDHFMMAPAAAEVSRPAGVAWLLPMNVAAREPRLLPIAINPERDIPERAGFIIDESMAGRELAFRRDAEVTRAGSAWIRATSAGMNFAHGVGDIGEWIPLPGHDRGLKLAAAFAHLFEHLGKVRAVHESVARG